MNRKALEPEQSPGYDPAEDLEVLEQAWIERLTVGDEPGSSRVVRRVQRSAAGRRGGDVSATAMMTE